MPTTYWYAAVATGQCNQRGLRGLHRQALLFAVPSGPIGLLVNAMTLGNQVCIFTSYMVARPITCSRNSNWIYVYGLQY